MTFLVHDAHKVDGDGVVDDFWLLAHGDTIVETGVGDAWRAAAERSAVPTENTVDANGEWLTPGFIDLHGHGGGGHSFDNGTDAITSALAAHRAHGTTRSVVSLVANPMEQLLSSLAVIADLALNDPLILGAHLEGPFLSYAQRGAHHADHLREPNRDDAHRLIDAARNTLCHVTIAPENDGAFDAIDAFVANDVVVGVGHTDADYSTMLCALDHGVTVLNHAFNAMPGIHHRSPGPVVAAFEDDRVTLELILDGHHVRPEIARLSFAAAPGRIALVTDAMAAAGSIDGDYRLGDVNVTVVNGLAVLSGTSTIAGSTLTQDGALRYALETARLDPVVAVRALTATPAKTIGREADLGYLRVGFAADAVQLAHDSYHVRRVWAAGEHVT